MLPDTFRGFVVTKDAAGRIRGELAQCRLDELPPGDALIRVAYSSLNYKDALAAQGHPGVCRTFPHIPGVDAAGYLVASGATRFSEGQPVLVTGFDVGASRWGGWAEYIQVPQDWVVPLPAGLTLRESMILGTAGFTAGLCLDALQKHDVRPESGEVVVTGASGGVGTFAVALLAKLGYQVAAVSGKPAAQDFLMRRGATRVLPREQLDDRTGKPLLSGRWAGAVDTVGSNLLGTVLRATRHGGCVAACGLAAGSDLPVTVFPFILRGITLAGIDAAWGPIPLRHQIWSRLADQWKPDGLADLARFVELRELPTCVEEILAGRVMGRIVVRVGAGDDAA